MTEPSVVSGLTFLWPRMLWALAGLPLIVIAYLRLVAHRREFSASLPALPMTAIGNPGADRLRRLVPPVLLFLALAAFTLAVARPHAVLSLPSRQDAIILAMDVSGSMRATDVKPNRLAAAQAAARTFVAEQPRGVRVGLVGIAGTAAVVQSPTDNREDLLQAIDRFQVQHGTALGSGIVVSLATLLPMAGIDVEQFQYAQSARARGVPLGGERKTVPPGSNDSAVIVLLTDGQNTVGPDPLEAAKLASEHGVRVFSVGFGTPAGTTLSVDGWSMRVKLDEDTLKKIATTTRGDYYQAATADDLKSIYRKLNARLVLEKRRSTEITALFAAAGALLAMLGAILSVSWFNRIL